jgi:hypothetical protein
MSIDPNVNDFFQGGGGASAKFPTPGTTIKGTVVRSVRTQQTNFDTGELAFWDEAKTQPKWQVVITLATDERDPDIEDDEGHRNLYVRGQMQKAVGDALAKAKAKLEVGGTLAVQYTGDGEPPRRGLNPPKLYTAAYKPPVAQLDGRDLLAAEQVSAGAQPAPADLI